jgi:hypothetical protein
MSNDLVPEPNLLNIFFNLVWEIIVKDVRQLITYSTQLSLILDNNKILYGDLQAFLRDFQA